MVTTTSTFTAEADGVFTVIVVSLSTDKLAAEVQPKVTSVAPIKFVPVIDILVLPAVELVVGAMLVKIGKGEGVGVGVGIAVVVVVVVTVIVGVN